MTTPLRVYHGFCGYRCGNAGDMITGPLVHALGGPEVQVVAEPEKADLFGSGSLLDGTHPNVVPPDSTAFVWGTGMLSEWSRFGGSARILALRGPLSWVRAGRPDVPLGDPGLLAPRLWPREHHKRYKLGIIPHYVDAQDERISTLARRHQNDVTVIDICGSLGDTMRAITSCRAVLSSCLHGLVFAAAYGVPNAWIRLSDKLVGGSFKFRDFAASLGLPDVMPIEFTSAETLEELADQCSVPDAATVTAIGDALIVALRAGIAQWTAEQEPAVPEGEAPEEEP
ncbi:MAG: polysaccharide pyruvyl transferase family protein [Gemmatimonadales bacterium]|nr:polysaccharide pyruvyl transferase family protein [Gemmatimonadales bacterium]